jgi:hypothetical protein
MLAELKQELANYKQQMDGAMAQLFQNQEAEKAGLDSTEANLRTFQKVLNGIVEDTLLTMPVPEQHPMSEVPPPKAKINWPEYYKLVDEEMQAMRAAAIEMEKQQTKRRLKILVEDKKFEWLKEKILLQISEQKAPEEIRLQQQENAAKFFATAQMHIDRAAGGEIYDTNRLEQLLQMITVSEKKAAEESGAVHQDEPPPEALGRLADEDAEHDGDTVVFGGDVEKVHEGHDD